MADQKININIGSSYSGEGMNAAMGAVNNLSRTAGKVAGAVGRLGETFEQLGGTAGKAIGSVSNMIGALAMGGPMGLAIAGVTALISVWQTHNEKVAEAKRKAEELNKEKKKLATEGMQEIKKQLESQLQLFDQIAARWNKLSTAIQNVNKSYTDLAGSFDNVEQAELAKKIQNDVDAAKTEEERQRIIARGNVEMSKLKAQASIGVAQAQVQRATENLSGDNGATARREQAETNLKRAESKAKTHSQALGDFMSQKSAAFNFFDEIRKLKESGNLIEAKQKYNGLTARGKADVDMAEQLYNNNQAASKAVQGAKDRLKAAQQEEEIANNKLLEATNNLTTARLNAETSVKKAEQQERDLLKAQKEAVEKQKQRNNLQKQLNDLQRQDAKDQKALDEKIKDAKKDLTDATKKAAELQDAFNNTPNGGIYNPNNQGLNPNGVFAGGRARGNTGPASNNSDNENNFTSFAKPEGWDDRWVKSHPKLAKQMGIKTKDELAKEAAEAAKKKKEQEDKVKALEAAKEAKKDKAYDAIVEIRDKMKELGLQ